MGSGFPVFGLSVLSVFSFSRFRALGISELWVQGAEWFPGFAYIYIYIYNIIYIYVYIYYIIYYIYNNNNNI